jgi:hypothetical protein
MQLHMTTKKTIKILDIRIKLLELSEYPVNTIQKD